MSHLLSWRLRCTAASPGLSHLPATGRCGSGTCAQVRLILVLDFVLDFVVDFVVGLYLTLYLPVAWLVLDVVLDFYLACT